MATSNGNGTPEVEPYEPKNILITGGAGFIASHVVIRITKNYPQYKVDSLGWCNFPLDAPQLTSLPRAGRCAG